MNTGGYGVLAPQNISHIDEFENLQGQMDEFYVRLENSLVDKRTNIMNDKQKHYVRVHELENQEQSMKRNIEQMKVKIDKTKELISKTLEDLQNQQLIVDDLNKKEEHLQELKKSVNKEIEDLNESISKLTNEYDTLKRNLADQVEKDYPELLKFVFNNIDPHEIDREVWCDVNVGGESLKVERSNPELGQEIIELLENEYDDHKELVIFLKTLRGLLKEKI
ncbi:hypothetical protein QCA50_017699 [Cerrena zonata]|uniref:Kinetochore protein SPC25 n=1 Tax=Cerrena zonata TaxID=2478898 RepID=A0AAW0FJU4_9APHY